MVPLTLYSGDQGGGGGEGGPASRYTARPPFPCVYIES